MRALVVVGMSLVLGPALGGKYNDTLSIGDAAPAWAELRGTDGKSYGLADFADKDVLVIAFTCNSCPYAVDYEDRFVAFAKEMKDGNKSVAFVAVNVNKVPEDLPEAMKKRAEVKSFNFPYVFDATQKIAKDYGAQRTPEVYVFDKERKLVYTGAMDDDASGKNVRVDYLRGAVTAALAGKSVELAETPPVGCAVRYEKVKRTRKP